MNINFSKMHGLGNDFVVIDAIHQSLNLTAEQVRLIADRRFGVGCDQLLLVENSQNTDAEFRYRIFNADGGEVEQCGNGARCFARFVVDKGLTQSRTINVETAGGLIVLQLEDDGQVTVNMGVPGLQPDRLPFIADQQAENYHLDVDGNDYLIAAVSMGNPHAVIRVDDVATAPVEQLGQAIESHPRFPQRVNVGFMQIVDRNSIKLRVYERGAGETLACGTGACAAMVAGNIQGWLDNEVSVRLSAGNLEIHWQGGDNPLYMTGPATHVFEGQIEL
ncbi:MAG: diaminopimelate epimerase [Gammaproteobacteria bacterium]|nr:diaminopimelate epimerase [Gammaproteobacteria bacterium]MCW8909837.1 diaminopimelate epimerase [Gammaproteobacteria bacterium]MCW9006092.1 diaminopimelate epimerase [Gammaproteobacteria bacterium]MCW9057033.1 diaminopimelate epimerase [Gammaproteobacteria bacterium]